MNRDAQLAATVDLHEPDAMGVWSDDDEKTWLPRSLYPRRFDAIKWAMDQWGVTLPEVRCRTRWMRYTPIVVAAYRGSEGDEYPGWSEDRWSVCTSDAAGAFRVWQLEAT